MWMRGVEERGWEGERGGNTDRGEREGEIADRTKSCQINFTDLSSVIFPPPLTQYSHSLPRAERTCGAGRQTLRMPSEPECRPGYLGS